MSNKERISEFGYSVDQLKKYIGGDIGVFSIMLNDGSIVIHYPDNVNEFKDWLDENGVINVLSTPI